MEEERENWLVRCRDEGHLNEWDIASAIDEAKSLDQLKRLLKFLIVEDMIKVWKAE